MTQYPEVTTARVCIDVHRLVSLTVIQAMNEFTASIGMQSERRYAFTSLQNRK